MTLTGFAQRAATFVVAIWLSTPAIARTVDLGTLEDLFAHPAERLKSQDVDAGEAPSLAHFMTARLGNDSRLAVLPGGEPVTYTFADVMSGTDRSIAVKSSAVRTVYRDVMSLAGRPKTEMWLALVVVAGLIALQLRRTQRLLHHRPLAR